MEQMLDLPVQSVPLRHLTKSRIRNNSRKILLPSKNHLKRNLIGQSIYSQQRYYSSTKAETRVDMSSNEDVRLKLPPPPVAKKPKVNLLSSSAKKSANVNANPRTEGELQESKQKPTIAPKPGAVWSTTSTSKEVNNNKHNGRDVDLTLSGATYNKLMNGTEIKDLNSPTRSSMTFSERLKASSLSRRKEANVSDGSQGQFRSQIISPIRRGSRSFLNSDSAIDNDTKPRPASSIFKRYSSETNMKLLETNEDEYSKDVKEDIDLDKFKDLTLEAVDPVAVDSVLSNIHSFEEDDAIKDSFDTDELFFKFGSNHTTSSREGAVKDFELMPSIDINIDSKAPNENLDHNEIQAKEQAQKNSYNKPESNPAVSFESSERNRPLLEVTHEQKKDEKKSLANSSSSQNRTQMENLTESSLGNVTHSNNESKISNPGKKFEQHFENGQTNPSRSVNSPRKFGKSKDGTNTRRKFKPVSLEEVTSHSKSASKMKTDVKGIGEVDLLGVSLDGSLDTDSSLEHVTQDIELDSTFEIPIQLSTTLIPNDAMRFKQNKGFDDEEGLIFVPDLSSSPPPMAPKEDMSDGLRLSMSSKIVAANNEKNTEHEFIQVNADPAHSAVQDSDELLVKALSVDVEMLPFVPPPPMDMDAFESDEDMTLNIIDPPTIYGDDDDMEFTASDDLPFLKRIIDHKDHKELKNYDALERNDEIMEEANLETRAKMGNTFSEIDGLEKMQEGSISQSGTVISSVFNETPDDTAHSQSIANMKSSDISVMAEESMPNVFSLAKQFDAATSNEKTRTKPVVPSKPANLMKRFIDKECTPEVAQASVLGNLKPPDQNSLLEIDALNGNQSGSEVSDKGRERRRSFSDRSASFDEGSPIMEDFHGGLQDECLYRTNSEDEPLLSLPDSSLVLTKSWLKETGQETSFEEKTFIEPVSSGPVGRNDIDCLPNLPRNHSIKSDVTSNADENLIIPSNEILPVYEQPCSRKSSIGGSNRYEASNNPVETERNVFRKKWSSFSSSSSDEKEDVKKVNIVKLMRERTLTQSDGNIDDDDDFVNDNIGYNENKISTSDDGLKFNCTTDMNSDIQDDANYVDDLGEVSLQEDPQFESTPVDEWTVNDVGDWLEIIGLADLRLTFEEKHIDGRQLQTIDLQLLDEIGITDVDDRELILSEIYALKIPEDFDIEMSLLDALDNVSGYDREKMLAVLEVLKMSSEDQENRYLPSSTPPKLSTGVRQKSPKSKKEKGNYRRAISEHAASVDEPNMDIERSKSTSPTKRSDEVWGFDSTRSNAKHTKSPGKKKSFLKEAFSFRRKRSGRLSKLFNSRKKLVDSSLKYLLQTTPQGIIKIWTNGIKDVGLDDVSLLVTATTTSLEVTRTVLEKLDLVMDANCYYLVQSHSRKSVPEIVLKDNDCPLVFQCRWPDAERYKFELKCHSEGAVIIVFSEEGNDERSVKIDTMMKTKCSQIIGIALKKLQRNETVNSFSLYQVKNNNKPGKQSTHESSQIPMDAHLLKAAPSTLQPAVFKLVRVNFLGSPEKSFKQDESLKLKELETEIREKERQLMRANELNSSMKAKLEDVTKNNEYLKQKFKDQNDDVARLENIADSLRKEFDQKSDGLSNLMEKPDNLEKEKLVKKLSRQELKTQSLEEWIQNLEKTLQKKEEEVRRLQDCQVKIGSYKNKEITEKSSKLKEMEEETTRLKSRIVEIENTSLEARVQFSEKENLLKEKNLTLEKEIERLKMDALTWQTDEKQQNCVHENNEHLLIKLSELEQLVESRNQTIASLRNVQIENEKLMGKVKVLQQEIAKNEDLSDELGNVSKVNEDLRSKIIALERSIKQNEQLTADASISQKNIHELRRELEVLSEEIAVKTKELEDAKQTGTELLEKFQSDLKLKDFEMEEVKRELNDVRKHNYKLDEERKMVKSRLREVETESIEKDHRLEELHDVHEEFMGQNQKVKRLERELTIKSDEVQKLNVEKDELLEDLRNHAENLEQRLIEKDSKILDLQFRIEKTERNLREAEDMVDDEVRSKNRLSIAVEDGLQQLKELSKKLDDYKRLLAEKDKIIQNLKGNQSNTEEALRRELTNSKRILVEKERMIDEIKTTTNEERMEMKSRFETLQGLVHTKEAKWKDKETRLLSEREAERSSSTQLEEKLNEKEMVIRNLEAKVSKFEKIARENMKKFEKFMSDKDKMLQQVKEESQREALELKKKIREMDESLREKEKLALRVNRSGSIRNEYEIKLKQKEEENKQHRFLLERLMSVANSRDPGILEEFENSFGQTPKPKDDKRPLLSKADDDWC